MPTNGDLTMWTCSSSTGLTGGASIDGGPDATGGGAACGTGAGAATICGIATTWVAPRRTVNVASGVSMISWGQSEENVGMALADPHTMIGSDSLSLHAGPGPHAGRPHPRSYGTFPRVLGEYCRERKLVSWETAVHKMTGKPAAKLRLRDRGLVRAGLAADLALFDPATVKDEATFADPHRHPAGLPYVIVNGHVVVDGPRFTAAPAGRVLTP